MTKFTYDYGGKLYSIINNLPDEYNETGKISGSKLGYASLTAVLKMIGVEVEFDDYTKGKFLRGHDLEARIIGLLWGIPPAENTWYDTTQGTKGCWQLIPTQSYRGTSVTIDFVEDFGEYYIIHEFKSCTKMAFDKVAGTGFNKTKANRAGVVIAPELKPHNAEQSALYGLTPLGKPVKCVMVHYLNADDYRMISFELNPEDYKEQIDNDINKIQEAFITKRFPIYEPRWGWDKGKYNNYSDFEKLTHDQIVDKLRRENKDALDKFMLARVDGDNIIYSEAV